MHSSPCTRRSYAQLSLHKEIICTGLSAHMHSLSHDPPRSLCRESCAYDFLVQRELAVHMISLCRESCAYDLLVQRELCI